MVRAKGYGLVTSENSTNTPRMLAKLAFVLREVQGKARVDARHIGNTHAVRNVFLEELFAICKGFRAQRTN